MLYTVKEVAELTGVTIKALHHYHKIGLLKPCEITDAGYRLYGQNELELLQQILFYRELDFPLNDIKKAMENEPSRIECLAKQQELLFARKQRLDCLLKNEQAKEAQQFIGCIRDALKNGWKANDERMQEILKNHITFLNSHGHNIDAKSFAAQTRFFLDDDFHRSMLENQLIGLSYYLCIAAEIYANSN